VPGKHKWAAGLSEDREALDYLTRLPFSISLPQLGLLVVHAGEGPSRAARCEQGISLTNKGGGVTRLTRVVRGCGTNRRVHLPCRCGAVEL
jgi:hypothetical protein